jgi:hypothetical protein
MKARPAKFAFGLEKAFMAYFTASLSYRSAILKLLGSFLFFLTEGKEM